MRSLATLFFVVLLGIVSIFSAAVAQPTARITVEYFSPQDVHDAIQPYADEISSGISNLGIGEKVYLRANPGETMTSYTWTLKEQPTNSSAALVQTSDPAVVTLVPDSTGQYLVGLVVTDASGTSEEKTLWINGGRYVGVGTVGTGTINIADFAGECAICHADIEAGWAETDHATFATRGLNGEVSSYYRESCLECHTVGYGSADNDGFDDRAEEAGWTFPATLESGTWDDFVANYPDVAKLANIQCENCHGPGSEHKGFTSKNQIAFGLEYGVCARCHEEEPRHFFPIQWKTSKHSTSFASAWNPTYMNRAGCEKCHTGTGFIEVTEKGLASTAPYDNPQPVTCQVCHDPHSADNPHQLRILGSVELLNGEVITDGGNGQLCMNCHQSRRNAEEYVLEYHSHFGPHHSNQADMLMGTNAIEYGVEIGSSGHLQALTNACVDCHLSEPDAAGKDFVGEHTFKMSNTDANGNRVENVKVCQSCHGAQIESFDDVMANEDYDGDGTIEGVVSEIDGLMDELGMLLPPVGDPSVTVTSDYTLNQLSAAYNYEFVADDHSHGVHNSVYAISILQLAIRALKTGDIGASAISMIRDVPNDQGKQVRIIWARFPGDGSSTDPLAEYGIWRRVDGLSKTAKQAGSINEMLTQGTLAKSGDLFQVNEIIWEYVLRVPASRIEKYSVIAPTLVDSNATGMNYTAFYISGYSQAGEIVATSVDSGYSVDNIAPLPPAKIAASTGAGKVTVSWDLDFDDPTNIDFAYFTVYRGTGPGFTPSVQTKILDTYEKAYTEDLQAGTTYYYRISAWDINGNESEVSYEVNSEGVITGIADVGGVPTSYALLQNYPNPFNPETTIKFALPVGSNVTLTVYDVRGVEIKTLISEYMPSGYATVSWDGTDYMGQSVASGIYLYRLVTNEFAETRKMIFLK